ncbi:transposase [Paenibacillus peoriae]|uniref:DUF6262 family protein n=1 Tax=Paenibacillus peoriae TaxID=59893 RepID=UPI000CEBE02E|nr:DUF6262 family protein [Paenibacillus peoriae]PPQ49278.1 transposase [Paenibacillus peoriae]
MANKHPDVSGLKNNAIQKRELAIARGWAAVRSLQAEGVQVNFSSVSNRSGVSKSFLYGHSELRTEIGRLRGIAPADIRNGGRSDESKNVIIQALKNKLEELRGQNRRLRAENEFLKSQLMSNLSDSYEKL